MCCRVLCNQNRVTAQVTLGQWYGNQSFFLAENTQIFIQQQQKLVKTAVIIVIGMVYSYWKCSVNWWRREVVCEESNPLPEARGQRQTRDWYCICSGCVWMCMWRKQRNQASDDSGNLPQYSLCIHLARLTMYASVILLPSHCRQRQLCSQQG